MADQGLWFKLWLGFDEDPQLGNFNDRELMVWIRLGCYLKKHGNGGMTCLSKPALALQRALRIEGYENTVSMLKKMPNIVVHEKQQNETIEIVTLTIEWKNWSRYQGDYSTLRVVKYREMKRFKKRREEKRREEKRRDSSPPPPKGGASDAPNLPAVFGPEALMRLWNRSAHPALARVKMLPRTREAHIKARLADFPTEADWQKIIEKVNASEFLTGQKTKWRMPFDWILNPQNLTKVMEGNYDGDTPR